MLAGPRLRSEARHIDTFISFVQRGASHQWLRGEVGVVGVVLGGVPFLAEQKQNSRQLGFFSLNFTCQSKHPLEDGTFKIASARRSLGCVTFWYFISVRNAYHFPTQPHVDSLLSRTIK